jgi:hypothetical protein
MPGLENVLLAAAVRRSGNRRDVSGGSSQRNAIIESAMRLEKQ